MTGSVVMGLLMLAGTPIPQPVDVPTAVVVTPAAIERAVDATVAQAGRSEWQIQMDEAVARKAAGKKKVLIGAIGMVGGFVLAKVSGGEDDAIDCVDDFLAGEDDDLCASETRMIYVGTAIAAVGAGVATWGAVQWTSANTSISMLNARKTEPALHLSFGDDRKLSFSLGKRTTANYRVSW